MCQYAGHSPAKRGQRIAGVAIAVFLFAVMVPPMLWGQGSVPPELAWQKTYGGAAWDAARSVRQTQDDGFIIAGFTWSYDPGKSDVYLVRLDPEGNLQWQRAYGGPDSEYAWSVQQTQDGGFITAGYTESHSVGGTQACLLKVDASGNLQWYRTYGADSYAFSVEQTRDGGFIAAGSTASHSAGDADVYLFKTDASGNQEWYQTYGGVNYDAARSVQQTQDGGFIVAGSTASYGAGKMDVYLVKTDASGNLQWQRTFGGPGNDYGWSVQQTQEGGFVVAGYTESFGAGETDVYLVKTHAAGNLQWARTYGGAGAEYAYSVQQTRDGRFIIAGSTASYGHGDTDVYLVKTDAQGNLRWDRTYGGVDSDAAYSAQETRDGGYVIAGVTGSYGAGDWDMYVIRLVKPSSFRLLLDILRSLPGIWGKILTEWRTALRA